VPRSADSGNVVWANDFERRTSALGQGERVCGRGEVSAKLERRETHGLVSMHLPRAIADALSQSLAA